MRSIFLLAFTLILSSPLCAVDRFYQRVPSNQDVADIRYIVENLADHSPVWIGLHVGALKSAGGRIESVHPLRFCEVIFTDESMKVAMRNLRKRGGRYWSEFMGGLRRSFSEERSRGNLTNEQVLALATRVEVDPKVILPAVQNGQWDRVLSLLIDHVPRKGDVNRYDL